MTESGTTAHDVHHGTSVEDIKQSFRENLFAAVGRTLDASTLNDKYLALALTVRERVYATGGATLEAYRKGRAVAYLSAEYLPGPHLANNLLSLGITEQAREAMTDLGIDFDALIEQEEEPGTRQRRPGTAGVVLHGFDGDARLSGHRLRASATSSGSSTRTSATAGKSE